MYTNFQAFFLNGVQGKSRRPWAWFIAPPMGICGPLAVSVVSVVTLGHIFTNRVEDFLRYWAISWRRGKNNNTFLPTGGTLIMYMEMYVEWNPNLCVHWWKQAPLASERDSKGFMNGLSVVKDPVDLGWKPYIHRWLSQLPRQVSREARAYLLRLFNHSVTQGLLFIKKHQKQLSLSLPEISIVMTLCSILGGFINFMQTNGGLGRRKLQKHYTYKD